MLKLIIKIEQPQVELVLERDNKMIDSTQWQDNNSLSVNLLAKIDALLKKNGLTVQELDKAEVQTSQDSYTSSRIARAVAKTLEFCLTNKKKSI